MASVVSICNRALQKLGASRITDITENSVNARACNAAYESVRDAMLRKHPWNFAVKRAQLAASTTTPAFDYLYSFPLPVDCLRLLPNNCVTDWQIEGGAILTNDNSPLNIRYIARITDPNMFDVLFCEALSCMLAKELCEQLTQSMQKAQTADNEYKQIVSEAKLTNAIENISADPPTDDWILARY